MSSSLFKLPQSDSTVRITSMGKIELFSHLLNLRLFINVQATN